MVTDHRLSLFMHSFLSARLHAVSRETKQTTYLWKCHMEMSLQSEESGTITLDPCRSQCVVILPVKIWGNNSHNTIQVVNRCKVDSYPTLLRAQSDLHRRV